MQREKIKEIHQKGEDLEKYFNELSESKRRLEKISETRRLNVDEEQVLRYTIAKINEFMGHFGSFVKQKSDGYMMFMVEEYVKQHLAEYNYCQNSISQLRREQNIEMLDDTIYDERRRDINDNPQIISNNRNINTPRISHGTQMLYNSKTVQNGKKMNKQEIESVLEDFDNKNKQLAEQQKAFLDEQHAKPKIKKDKNSTREISIKRNNFVDEAAMEKEKVERVKNDKIPHAMIKPKKFSNEFLSPKLQKKIEYSVKYIDIKRKKLSDVLNIDPTEMEEGDDFVKLKKVEKIALDLDLFLHKIVNQACMFSSARKDKKLDKRDLFMSLKLFENAKELKRRK